MKKQQYQQYLKSPEWQKKRQAALDKANTTCQNCGAVATQVHHESYGNIGDEQPNDLIPLCAKCHMRRHKINIDPFGTWALSQDVAIQHNYGSHWAAATHADVAIQMEPDKYQQLARALRTSVRIAAILDHVNLMFACGDIKVTPTLTKHLADFVDIVPGVYDSKEYRIKPDFYNLFPDIEENYCRSKEKLSAESKPRYQNNPIKRRKKAKPNPRQVTCAKCNSEFAAPNHRYKYCPTCRQTRVEQS